MARPGICPQCGDRLPADEPHGVCPKCMLGLGFNDPNPDQTDGFQVTVDPSGRFDAPAPESLTKHFPQLEILELIGQGGMGAVYKARQKTLDRVVALKVLPPVVGRDPAFAERFMREARALARLTHPNIVMVFDFGESDGYYYFIMEFVDGVNLRQSLHTGRLSPEQALAIVPQVCEALQFAHDEGIVHRDIKPENVLLDKRGNVKIADFGLAKLLGRPGGKLTLTGTGQVMGTPQYMAPEQMEKPLTVDHRADIYSLGVVFYELLTGELPIGRFAPPSSKTSVSSELDEVVFRTLEKEPSARYQHASEVKTAVETARLAPATGQQPPQPMVRQHRLRVPFSIGDVYGGLAKCEGIARFDGRELTLEFEVKDDVVGYVSSGIKTATIPLSEIVSLELTTSRWARRNTLELRTDQLSTLRDVPRSERGRVLLRIARHDIELAQLLAATVREALGLSADRDQAAVGTGKPPVAHPSVNLDVARRDVRGPAVGLLVVGVLNCLTPLLVALLAFPVWTHKSSPQPEPPKMRLQARTPGTSVTIRTRDGVGATRIESPPPEVRPHVWVEAESVADAPAPEADFAQADGSARLSIFAVLITVVFGAMLPLTISVFVILGAAKMRRLEGYGWCLTAGILAVLPLHPWIFIGLPLGIWALVTLTRRETRDAFREQRRQRFTTAPGPLQSRESHSVPPAKPIVASPGQPAESLKIPAIGLVVVGSVNVVAFFALWLVALRIGGLSVYAVFLFSMIPLVMALLQLKGGVHMLNHKSYVMATVGAVVAILPTTLLWPVSLVMGIWALIVLQREEVKQLFHADRRHEVAPHRGSSVSMVVALLVLATFVLFGVVLGAYFLSYSRMPRPDDHAIEVHDAGPEGDVEAFPLPEKPPMPALPDEAVDDSHGQATEAKTRGRSVNNPGGRRDH